ncbi:MAG TPA: Os1348 family NHLP clan protein [Chloroflexota bacterium]|jgi:hypothetical protein
MSWEAIQAVIGQALVDREFRDQLLTAPAEAIRRFDLTPDERRVLGSLRARNLAEYASHVETWLEEQRRAPRRSTGRTTARAQEYTRLAC